VLLLQTCVLEYVRISNKPNVSNVPKSTTEIPLSVVHHCVLSTTRRLAFVIAQAVFGFWAGGIGFGLTML
jgi:hypothetical protein